MGERIKFEKVPYRRLNARQKENHNFAKLAAALLAAARVVTDGVR